MSEMRCWGCGTPGPVSMGGKCQACLINDNARERQREADKQRERERERDRLDREWEETQRRWERQEEMEYQAQVDEEFRQQLGNTINKLQVTVTKMKLQALEDKVTDDQATSFGRGFFERYYAPGKELDELATKANVYVFYEEDGTVWYSTDGPFQSDRLNAAFKTGLGEAVSEVPALDAQYLRDAAFNAGKNLMGNFYLAGQDFRGYLVKTVDVDSGLTSTVDPETGFVSYSWNYPFADDTLNQCYADGVNAAAEELNTPEQMAKNVEEIRAEEERQRIRREKEAEADRARKQREANEEFWEKVGDAVKITIGAAFIFGPMLYFFLGTEWPGLGATLASVLWFFVSARTIGAIIDMTGA